MNPIPYPTLPHCGTLHDLKHIHHPPGLGIAYNIQTVLLKNNLESRYASVEMKLRIDFSSVPISIPFVWRIYKYFHKSGQHTFMNILTFGTSS